MYSARYLRTSICSSELMGRSRGNVAVRSCVVSPTSPPLLILLCSVSIGWSGKDLALSEIPCVSAGFSSSWLIRSFKGTKVNGYLSFSCSAQVTGCQNASFLLIRSGSSCSNVGSSITMRRRLKSTKVLPSKH